MYDIDWANRLSAACLLCGRSPLPVRIDRSQPERTEHIEAALIRERKR